MSPSRAHSQDLIDSVFMFKYGDHNPLAKTGNTDRRDRCLCRLLAIAIPALEFHNSTKHVRHNPDPKVQSGRVCLCAIASIDPARGRSQPPALCSFASPLARTRVRFSFAHPPARDLAFAATAWQELRVERGGGRSQAAGR